MICQFPVQVFVFVSSDCLKCRLLKWLLAQPMKVVMTWSKCPYDTGTFQPSPWNGTPNRPSGGCKILDGCTLGRGPHSRTGFAISSTMFRVQLWHVGCWNDCETTLWHMGHPCPHSETFDNCRIVVTHNDCIMSSDNLNLIDVLRWGWGCSVWSLLGVCWNGLWLLWTKLVAFERVLYHYANVLCIYIYIVIYVTFSWLA